MIINITFFTIFITFIHSEELFIHTTYEAEDAGIQTITHPQCKGWRLWRKTQDATVDLSGDDIDLLARRRSEVTISNDSDAKRFDIPEELLLNYSTIHISFETVCRLYPRILRITSSRAADRYGLNKDILCQNNRITRAISTNEVEIGKEELPSDVLSVEDQTDQDKQTSTPTIPSIIVVNNSMTALSYGLDSSLLRLHSSILIMRDSVCSDTQENDENEEMSFYQEKFGAFGFDVSTLGESIEELTRAVNNIGHIDNILRVLSSSDQNDVRPFPATHILPWLKRVKYDPRTPPVLFVGDRVTIKMGLQIESMSNFELSTMDYNVDAWLRMAWFDPRLRHRSSRAVLINEYTFLRKIWRPDPVFPNSKLAAFHKVSYLNFYMFIFPGGEVLMDIRVHLRPTAAQIVLCKYPHDSPSCALKITSLGFTQDVVHFEWFSNLNDAIRLNADVQIPELFLLHHSADRCDGTRKSGNYSCIEARFRMRRDIGYHLAQTYIPTSICVVFSWISVWLPEEFVEGRIFVSLTVFLTLSAENNSAKEELPKVSYVKAIDIWFGFTSTFVFLTMVQALIVISLEHSSNKLRKKCEKQADEASKYDLARWMLQSRYYHRLGRDIDTWCKVLYPVSFVLFLIIYGFVITQGDERKCLKSGQ